MKTGPRDIAVRALRDRSGNVTAHLDRLFKEIQPSAADRALANELAVGVLKHRATLDAVIRSYLHQRKKQLPAPIKQILQVAVYQILFLQRVPAFAAVDEAVKQTTASNHKKQSGMVNGILRTMIREMSAPIPAALETAPQANVIPVGQGMIRRIGRPIFYDPAKRFADYLSQAYSLPVELVQRWLGRFDEKKTTALAAQTLQRPSLVCRVNSMRSDVAAVVQRLADEGVEAKPHRNGHSVVLPSADGLTKLAVFQEGLIQPQDPTATDVVLAAKIKPGMRVLDFCAAPGTKTTHIAERMNNEGEIIALDVSREKLRRIEENCQRLGVTCVTTMLAEEAGGLDIHGFDLVLADVPCSNTGVLARRPEARWRFANDAMGKLIKDQQFLASAASQFLAPGGQLIYSTCSIEPDEDTRVAKSLAKRMDHVRFMKDRLTLPNAGDDPTQWCDGGYYAILEGK